MPTSENFKAEATPRDAQVYEQAPPSSGFASGSILNDDKAIDGHVDMGDIRVETAGAGASASASAIASESISSTLVAKPVVKIEDPLASVCFAGETLLDLTASSSYSMTNDARTMRPSTSVYARFNPYNSSIARIRGKAASSHVSSASSVANARLVNAAKLSTASGKQAIDVAVIENSLNSLPSSMASIHHSLRSDPALIPGIYGAAGPVSIIPKIESMLPPPPLPLPIQSVGVETLTRVAHETPAKSVPESVQPAIGALNAKTLTAPQTLALINKIAGGSSSTQKRSIQSAPNTLGLKMTDKTRDTKPLAASKKSRPAKAAVSQSTKTTSRSVPSASTRQEAHAGKIPAQAASTQVSNQHVSNQTETLARPQASSSELSGIVIRLPSLNWDTPSNTAKQGDDTLNSLQTPSTASVGGSQQQNDATRSSTTVVANSDISSLVVPSRHHFARASEPAALHDLGESTTSLFSSSTVVDEAPETADGRFGARMFADSPDQVYQRFRLEQYQRMCAEAARSQPEGFVFYADGVQMLAECATAISENREPRVGIVLQPIVHTPSTKRNATKTTKPKPAPKASLPSNTTPTDSSKLLDPSTLTHNGQVISLEDFQALFALTGDNMPRHGISRYAPYGMRFAARMKDGTIKTSHIAGDLAHRARARGVRGQRVDLVLVTHTGENQQLQVSWAFCEEAIKRGEGRPGPSEVLNHLRESNIDNDYRKGGNVKLLQRNASNFYKRMMEFGKRVLSGEQSVADFGKETKLARVPITVPAVAAASDTIASSMQIDSAIDQTASGSGSMLCAAAATAAATIEQTQHESGSEFDWGEEEDQVDVDDDDDEYLEKPVSRRSSAAHNGDGHTSRTAKQLSSSSLSGLTAVNSSVQNSTDLSGSTSGQSTTHIAKGPLPAGPSRVTRTARSNFGKGLSRHSPYGTRFTAIMEDGTIRQSYLAGDLIDRARTAGGRSRGDLLLMIHKGEVAQLEAAWSFVQQHHEISGKTTQPAAAELLARLESMGLDINHRKKGTRLIQKNAGNLFKRVQQFGRRRAENEAYLTPRDPCFAHARARIAVAARKLKAEGMPLPEFLADLEDVDMTPCTETADIDVEMTVAPQGRRFWGIPTSSVDWCEMNYEVTTLLFDSTTCCRLLAARWLIPKKQRRFA
eukprot:jgi/Hompol1/3423/HPOL_003234-RA